MNFQLTYRLIQQTPLIHFQHDQKGATLRATEVKPKLDKFIIKKIGKDDIPKEWFLKDTEALNYKLRIVAAENTEYINIGFNTDYDIFYGNMGDSASFKKGAKGNCVMTVICFIPDLLGVLKDFIGEFFIVTNFGTMQNKGFGSYIVEQSDTSPEIIAKYLKAEYGAKECYYFRSAPPSRFNGEKDERFKDIKTVYSVMKSGINFRDYHRSFLFEYCHKEMHLGNEKAAMKANKISPWSGGEPVKKPSNNKNFWEWGSQDYKYVRAMLGIGERIEYIRGFHFDDKKNKIVPDRDKETIKISNSDIERLASPIKFKVIGDCVYMYAARINPKILNNSFSFTNSKGNSINLKTPETFDIDKFLSWFVEKYNKDSFVRNSRNEPVSYSIKKRIEPVVCREG